MLAKDRHPCFVRISKPVRNRLRAYSRRNGHSMSELATKIIETYLNRSEAGKGKEGNSDPKAS